MNMKILAGLLLFNTNVYAEEDNSSIYEEAILPSFAESNYYQTPQVSIDFELDIMLDSSRFGAELKFSQAFGSYFSIVESASYYSADTAVIDYDKQYIAGAGAVYPFKRTLGFTFFQIDLGYLGWVSEQSNGQAHHLQVIEPGLKLNLTNILAYWYKEEICILQEMLLICSKVNSSREEGSVLTMFLLSITLLFKKGSYGILFL